LGNWQFWVGKMDMDGFWKHIAELHFDFLVCEWSCLWGCHWGWWPPPLGLLGVGGLGAELLWQDGEQDEALIAHRSPWVIPTRESGGSPRHSPEPWHLVATDIAGVNFRGKSY